MERVADLIEERRDDLARTLTLDQGKPLHAEAYGEVEELVVYWRMAAADATRLHGSMPPSVDAAKRILAYRVPRGVVGVITPWNWPYTMPAELIAPALAAGNAVVWTPASSTSVCAVKLAECIVDAELPPGVFSMVTGPGPVVGDEIAGKPGHARDRLHRLGRDRPPRRRARRRQDDAARARRERADGRARRRRPRRRGRGEHRRVVPLRGPELHRGRALPRARGRPRRVRRDACRPRSSARSGSATRSRRRRRWAR